MEDAAKADTVRKAMADAGLKDKMVSAFKETDLWNLHAGGYQTSASFKSAREKDLKACGIPQGLIGILCVGARVQGDRGFEFIDFPRLRHPKGHVPNLGRLSAKSNMKQLPQSRWRVLRSVPVSL